MHFFFFHSDGTFNTSLRVHADKIRSSGSASCSIEVIACSINIDHRFNCKVVLVKIFIRAIIGKIIAYCFEIPKADMQVSKLTCNHPVKESLVTLLWKSISRFLFFKKIIHAFINLSNRVNNF